MSEYLYGAYLEIKDELEDGTDFNDFLNLIYYSEERE